MLNIRLQRHCHCDLRKCAASGLELFPKPFGIHSPKPCSAGYRLLNPLCRHHVANGNITLILVPAITLIFALLYKGKAEVPQYTRVPFSINLLMWREKNARGDQCRDVRASTSASQYNYDFVVWSFFNVQGALVFSGATKNAQCCPKIFFISSFS